MSQSNLQLLLHAGEVEYIVKNINEAQNKKCKFVGGCLFGLWRNSLKQPVIQFVTGPDVHFKDRQSIGNFIKSENVSSCADIMMEKHCLLHLGFWFCCSDHDKVEQLVFESGEFNVLLFISYSKDGNGGQLGGEYLLRKDDIKAKSPLYLEDVLPDHSSFRKFAALTNKIYKNGAMVAVHKDQPVRQDTLNLLNNLPSRVQVEVAHTSDKQWYSTDEGMLHLQLLFQYFQEKGITPEMSRDTATQDMQFGLGADYTLDFPPNFPREMPVIRNRQGDIFRMDANFTHDEDVCAMVVRRVTDFLRKRQQSSGRGSYGNGGRNSRR